MQAHDTQLSGHRVKVIVLDETEEDDKGGTNHPDPNEAPTLDQLLAGRIGKFSSGPADLSTRAEEAFAEIMDEKYRAQKTAK